MTSVPLGVPIIDDNILENNEQFRLNFSNTLPDRVTVGNPSQTTVTITDNDGKISVLISFFCSIIIMQTSPLPLTSQHSVLMKMMDQHNLY